MRRLIGEERCLMWKPEHRAAADRRGLRYPSDLTDAECAGCPADPPSQTRRAASFGERVRGSQRHLLGAVDGVPGEGAAEGLATAQARSGTTWTCGLGRHAGA